MSTHVIIQKVLIYVAAMMAMSLGLTTIHVTVSNNNMSLGLTIIHVKVSNNNKVQCHRNTLCVTVIIVIKRYPSTYGSLQCSCFICSNF